VNWIQIKTKLLRSFPPDARYLIALLHWLISLDYKRLIVLPFESSIAWPGTLIRRQTDPECMLAAIGRAL
jgi:hypothetical protein